MCINESRTHELPVSEPVNDELRSSGPTMMNKDIVQFVLVRVVHNEGDSSIRFDPQDGAGNVLDLGGSQGVNEGPNEDLPGCSWHGHVGEFERSVPCSRSRQGRRAIRAVVMKRARVAFEMKASEAGRPR